MINVHLSLPDLGGADLTAWVSAGAAVVQAIGAILAIWYSGKLAREAAAREIAADAAANRRIEEANAAAEEQRRIDRVEAEARRVREENIEHDAPLLKAAGLGDGALADLRIILEQHKNNALSGDQTNYTYEVREQHKLAFDLLPVLAQAARDARSANAIRALQTVLQPNSGVRFAPASELVEYYEALVERVDRAVQKIRHELKSVPR